MDTPPLYLPLLDSQVNDLISGIHQATELFVQWGYPEVASISVIQHLPVLAGKPNGDVIIEKALATLISTATELAGTQPSDTFASLIAARFNSEAFARGLSLLPEMRVRLLDHDAFAARDYLTSEGQWDYTFRSRHAVEQNPVKEEFLTQAGRVFGLSDQQARAFRTLRAEPDESMHIQGLAGSGKTHLIHRIVESYAACRPLILAFTSVQLQALLRRVGSIAVTGMTFSDLANFVLERAPGYRRSGKRSSPRYQLASSEIASRLGFGYVGSFSPGQVASLCARMVASFCQTTDSRLSDRHIPKALQLAAVDRAALVEFAQVLWEQTTAPTDPTYQLPLRGYHRIKHMTLACEAFIDHGFTHIIVDEAHDLSRPLADFLDRCTQPVITLGDACQRLDGLTFGRAGNLRKREISHSLRAGRQIEAVINPLIDKHPVLKLASLEGNMDIETRITRYDKADIPHGPATILVDSEWGLFEWFQRLGFAGVTFSLLPGAVPTFRRFILDCIDLYHDGIRPQHSTLFRYGTWEELRADVSDSIGSFHRVEQLLSKGYRSSDFEASLLKLDESGEAPIKLGRVADARNSEIDVVMLAPDLLGANVKAGDRVAVSKAFAALYTGGTRARHHLIVPGYLSDWATDMSRAAIAQASPAELR
ncbi:AAA family ATPase [Pseudomonas monteilii]|uniref:AAA family ATPase n=1 Tax=Pseudomonas monteilii TaxID=76759 RepID=UPI0015F8F549|nr:AAA family ATPase [Pseudomonas monteilii]MBA6105244.1 AAA family ATPase [Pseudomonas monteilii]